MAVTQYWNRIYRPYLEFMFLTNSYHFYSPDPSPAMYLWFRVLVEDDAKPDGAENVTGESQKIPDLDEHGRHAYPMGIDLQHFLCLTDGTNATRAVCVDWSGWTAERGLRAPASENAGSRGYHGFQHGRARYRPLEHRTVSEHAARLPTVLIKETLLPCYVRHIFVPRNGRQESEECEDFSGIREYLAPEKFRMGIVARAIRILTLRSIWATTIGKASCSIRTMLCFTGICRRYGSCGCQDCADSLLHASACRDPQWIRDKNGQWTAPVQRAGQAYREQ